MTPAGTTQVELPAVVRLIDVQSARALDTPALSAMPASSARQACAQRADALLTAPLRKGLTDDWLDGDMAICRKSNSATDAEGGMCGEEPGEVCVVKMFGVFMATGSDEMPLL